MLTEGVHDIDEGTYHADPCPEPSLSSSISKVLVTRSPRHAWAAHPRLNPQHQQKHAQHFDLGSAFHRLFLGKGAEIAVIEADDWRSKAAQLQRDQAREAGLIPMLVEQHDRAQRMATAVRAQVAAHPEAGPAFLAGAPERAIVWREDNGVWCRALLDWMPERGLLYPDLKTTEGSAGPEAWGRTMLNIGCDVQDAFYRRGLKKLGICEDPRILFVVAELEEPDHLIATHRCGSVASAIGDRKVEYAIRLFGACQAASSWPGYSELTACHDHTPWSEQDWIDAREPALDALIDRLEAMAA